MSSKGPHDRSLNLRVILSGTNMVFKRWNPVGDLYSLEGIFEGNQRTYTSHSCLLPGFDEMSFANQNVPATVYPTQAQTIEPIDHKQKPQ